MDESWDRVTRERVETAAFGGVVVVEVEEERRERLLLRVVGPEDADEVASARLRLRVSIQRINPTFQNGGVRGGDQAIPDPQCPVICNKP